jgi:hypothetical protein
MKTLKRVVAVTLMVVFSLVLSMFSALGAVGLICYLSPEGMVLIFSNVWLVLVMFTGIFGLFVTGFGWCVEWLTKQSIIDYLEELKCTLTKSSDSTLPPG